MAVATVKDAIHSKLRMRLGTQWQVGDRLPTIRDLARELGVGQSNTHEAVRELVADGLLQSRQRAGTFVIRVPKMGEQRSTAVAGASWTVALACFTPQSDAFVQRAADAFVREVGQSGLKILPWHIALGDPHPQFPDAVDACAFFNPPTDFAPHLNAIWQPVVVASTSWAQISTLPAKMDAVGVNDYQGARLAGLQVEGQSQQDVGFIGAVLDWPTGTRLEPVSAGRLSGFESGWGKTIRPDHIIHIQAHSLFSGGRAFDMYMKMPHRPRILFAGSDDLAVGFAAAASTAGLRVGQDFHLIGFDGQDRGQHLVEGSLTTVVVPMEEMGRRAAQLLRDRFADPQRAPYRLQLDCSFHPGNTFITS